MNLQLPQTRDWTADEFLERSDGREGKYEFVRGKIVMMTGGTRGRAELCLALGAFLRPLALQAGYGIANDWAVRTSEGIRYPGVVIFPREGSVEALATAEPVFAAEILSPSSLAIDFNEKAEESTSLPSLLHYLVLAQDEPRAWIRSRDADGRFGRPEMVAGEGETVQLPALGLALPLAELHRGIA
jgi:Uma2 family endonuclease